MSMGGGLDDALARMARWDALRQRLANAAAGRVEPAVNEVIEAIGAVLQRHGPLTVTVSVEGVETVTTAQLVWRDGQLTVARSEPQAVPEAARPPAETSDQTAARLAELIRRDPSLLDGRDDLPGAAPGLPGRS
ncbi:MAG: hypothetical protein AUI14_05345 [Actinobacteria bacterium 13_2_20CM_2_71_6]|nr:MAG: hypothetical protein AUI14_05345 [Actinobacteria bacterium 13_2_20CM_2_71_6]